MVQTVIIPDNIVGFSMGRCVVAQTVPSASAAEGKRALP